MEWHRNSRLSLNGIRTVLVAGTAASVLGISVASSENLTVAKFEGSYFSPNIDSSCHFGGSVYHISDTEMTFRSEGSEFELFKNITVKNLSESVLEISGVPDDIEIAGRKPKKVDIQFEVQMDQIVPVSMYLDGEKFVPRQEFVSQYTLRKCDKPTFFGSALLWLGINSKYSEEGLIRYKKGTNGKYRKFVQEQKR